MNLPWNILAPVFLLVVIFVATVVLTLIWMNGRRERRKAPVRPARRRIEPDREPVPSRDPQPTSEDHDTVEAFFRSLNPPKR